MTDTNVETRKDVRAEYLAHAGYLERMGKVYRRMATACENESRHDQYMKEHDRLTGDAQWYREHAELFGENNG